VHIKVIKIVAVAVIGASLNIVIEMSISLTMSVHPFMKDVDHGETAFPGVTSDSPARICEFQHVGATASGSRRRDRWFNIYPLIGYLLPLVRMSSEFGPYGWSIVQHPIRIIFNLISQTILSSVDHGSSVCAKGVLSGSVLCQVSL
jgi:hypothetical protein